MRLWLLRGFLETSSGRRLRPDEDDEDDEETDAAHLRQLFGLGALAPDASPRVLASALRGALKAAEAVCPDALPGVEALGTEIGLTEMEQDLLLFAALAKARGLFQRGLGLLGRVVGGQTEVIALIAACLGVTVEEVTAALARAATLTAMGLVTLSTEGCGHDLDDWLDTSPDLLARLLEPNLSAATLLASYLKSASEAPRDLADFTHLAGVIALARPLLTRAADGLRGVNILLYGPPGTGKTALARALAADVGVRLLEVAVADARGEALESPGRARALRLVTHLGAKGGRAIVLFDEVEDYFRADNLFLGLVDRVGSSKGFSIDLLEQAASPVIWIGNRIDDIDPALLRRFSLACEIAPPPTAVRARLATEYLAPLGLSDHPLVGRIARHEGLVPGVLSQGARTTALAAIADSEARAEYCAQTLNGLLTVLGREPLPGREGAALTYDAAFVNADCDLALLAAGVQRVGCARLLCAGAPGTGKSEWVRHLAEVLGRPLLVVRASDLLDPYVGMSERHMAEMFARAHTQRAVLLLDECDSFLRSRAGAQHRWEITQVNEMLTQIERFDGVFIATTNAREDLDEAVFRRFDRLITFRPLTRDQRQALVARVLRDHDPRAALSLPDARVLDQCEGLTVGDVAAALRGLRLDGTWTPTAFVRAIHAACGASGRGRGRGMGFTTAVS